jgi:alcohol dehydrogenase (cytochrome c)
MNRKHFLIPISIVGELVVIGAAVGGGLYYVYPVQVSTLAGMTRNYLISWFAPPGTTATELNAAYKAAEAAGASPPAASPSPNAIAGDWPSYNQTLTSDRYSQLTQINTKNVGRLKVLCTYNVDQYAAFESGLIMVDNALIGTTQFDIFSLNPATCALNWRTHEDYPPSLLPANRGAAYMDGMLFRGTQDGRVLAYDFETGKRLWETTIADTKHGESVPSAPIASDGLVYVGNGPAGRNAFLLIEFEQCFCGRFRRRLLEVILRPRHVADLRANCTVAEAVSACMAPPTASATVEPSLPRPWRSLGTQS